MRWALLAVLVCAAGPVAAQSPVYESSRGGGSFELRSFSFAQGIELRRASQLALPVFAGRPLGSRMFVDLTASYAATTLEAHDGARQQLSGLTDTQLRASYTASEALVFSLGLNLPSGVSRIATSELAVIRSAAQNFLPFPVSNYGTGFGVAGGAVASRRVGEWNLGLAGSLRYIGSYQPFTDAAGKYAPGLEGRLRLGFQRLLGERTSLAGGLTYTTFGTDEFTGVPAFVYRAGNRYIGELSLTRQLGRSSARLFTWSYWRTAGDSSGATVERARESILHGGLLLARPVSARVQLDAGLEGRDWRASKPTHGWVIGLRGGSRYRLSSVVTVTFSARWETGHIWLDLGDAAFNGLGISMSLVAGN